MTTWIASLALPADSPTAERAAARAAALESFGAAPLCAWLENPLSFEHGLELRDKLALDAAGALIGGWPIGRLFNDMADLRWERAADGGEHFVVIADEQPPPPFKVYSHELDPIDPARSEELILLWGERQDGEWREGRIPQIGRCYPKTWTGPRAAIRARTYEAAWPEAKSVRVIVRYLGYDGAHTPKLDKEDQQ